MATIALTVTKATASTNGGFILKLVNDSSMVTPFGNKKQTKTLYMKVETAPKVGFKADLDLDMFVIVPREYQIPEDAEENAGEIIMLDWLQLPVAV